MLKGLGVGVFCLNEKPVVSSKINQITCGLVELLQDQQPQAGTCFPQRISFAIVSTTSIDIRIWDW